MEKTKLIEELNKVEKLTNASKLSRFINSPINYVIAISHRQWVYKKTKEGLLRDAETFFGRKMQVMLPAGIDIFITNAKSHSSEIRLAKYLINHLNQGDTFFDIGAHFGYFTLLASYLVGNLGKVFSFEASNSTFKILSHNVKDYSNIKTHHQAVSNNNEPLKFYEFPVLFSEYNSSDITQYQHDDWFYLNKPTRVIVEATTLNQLQHLQPKIIKIDVEGAEQKVMEGGLEFLKNNNAVIIMEYLEPKRYNVSHRNALAMIQQLGYSINVINKDGFLSSCDDIETYLANKKLESDNVVFVKNLAA